MNDSNRLALYQQMIIDHNKRPRNFGKPERHTHSAEGFNPLCGDQITVYLTLDGDRVREASFKGSGCAISKASASLMTAVVKGKTVAEVEELFGNFRDMVTSGHDEEIDEESVGKLVVLKGVREFPVRVKCATLAWHTLRAALEDKAETVKTE